MTKLGGGRKGGGSSLTSLNNVLMQMRKNCNHPDLITAPFEGEAARRHGAACCVIAFLAYWAVLSGLCRLSVLPPLINWSPQNILPPFY